MVQDKLVEITEDEPVRSQTYQGGPTTIGQHVDHDFTVTETGIDLLKVDLDWPSPDDLDLEVYKKNADGSLTQVGSSGNSVGEKESAEIAAPAPGDYVLRVINFASTTPTYTLKSTLFNSTTVSSETVPGLIENWTLTCEKDGQVLQQRVGRGRPWRAAQGGPLDLRRALVAALAHRFAGPDGCPRGVLTRWIHGSGNWSWQRERRAPAFGAPGPATTCCR